MAANTGRTVGKWFKFQMEDSAGTLRDIPVTSINGIGIAYDQTDLTALQDALKGFKPGHGTSELNISGPFDNTAAQAASGSGARPALSGSHTVLNGVNGVNTPLAFACYFGIQHDWETGEPVYGLASSAANGVLVTNYTVNAADMTYSATLVMYPGSAAPAWGTAAIA